MCRLCIFVTIYNPGALICDFVCVCTGLKPTTGAFFFYMLTVALCAYTATSMAFAISADQTVVAIANIFMTITCVFMMVMHTHQHTPVQTLVHTHPEPAYMKMAAASGSEKISQCEGLLDLHFFLMDSRGRRLCLIVQKVMEKWPYFWLDSWPDRFVYCFMWVTSVLRLHRLTSNILVYFLFKLYLTRKSL